MDSWSSLQRFGLCSRYTSSRLFTVNYIQLYLIIRQVKTEGGKNKWFPLGEKLSALIEDHYAKFSDKPLIITADDKRIEVS